MCTSVQRHHLMCTVAIAHLYSLFGKPVTTVLLPDSTKINRFLQLNAYRCNVCYRWLSEVLFNKAISF